MRQKHIIFIVLLILLPFFFVALFNVPCADDLARTNAFRPDNLLTDFSNWYLHHNGRFANALITLNPFWYNLTIYRISFFIFTGIFYYSNYLLLKTVFSKLPTKKSHIISLVFVTLTFLNIPSPAEGFYWFASATAYILPFSLNLILISLLIRLFHKPSCQIKWYWWIIIITIVLTIVGSHEITMFNCNLTLLIFLLLRVKKTKKIDAFSILLILTSITGSLVLIFSPGTLTRQEAEHGVPLLEAISFTSIDFFLQFIATTQ